MRVTFSVSADKHGVSHDSAVYAVEHAVYLEPSFTAAQPPATVRPTLFIGPSGPCDQTLLEVFVEITATRVKVFHVMIATPATLEKLGDASE